MTNAIEVHGVSYHHGRVIALKDASLSVPKGALYALLGPNGSGKTTLLQCLMGLRTPRRGTATLLGVDSRALTAQLRTRVGYVAEGQSLPRHMRLAEVETFLAPLYNGRWDLTFARSLRERFALDPSRRIRQMSRGEQMKASMLCALAPRPELLVMDEPFTGMDALVKDELVAGLLELAYAEGTTVFLCSHDIGELELLADHVGYLDGGEILISETMEGLLGRFMYAEFGNFGSVLRHQPLPDSWLHVQSSGNRTSFVIPIAEEMHAPGIAARFPGADLTINRDATLREIFVAFAQRNRADRRMTNGGGIAA